MKRSALLLSLFFVCILTAAQAQTPAPKPGPELRKFQVWLGHWKGVAEVQPGWWRPAGKIPFDETLEMILGGFFMQSRVTLANPTRHELWISGYDPANKNYPTIHYTADGRIVPLTLTVGEGNTWTFISNGPGLSHDGKDYLERLTVTFSADSMSRQEKVEISEDGKTWTTIVETKGTKVKPAAKK